MCKYVTYITLFLYYLVFTRNATPDKAYAQVTRKSESTQGFFKRTMFSILHQTTSTPTANDTIRLPTNTPGDMHNESVRKPVCLAPRNYPPVKKWKNVYGLNGNTVTQSSYKLLPSRLILKREILLSMPLTGMGLQRKRATYPSTFQATMITFLQHKA